MAKRGRKPGANRKGYFYEQEEQAIVDYITTTSITEKNKIFNEILCPALTKMIESIIRRYKLYVPDEDFTMTFDDTISYLLTKLNNFKPIMLMYEEVTDNLTNEIKEGAKEISAQEFIDLIDNIGEEGPKYIKVLNEERYIYYEKVEKKYKAYSYCGTICKNYLIYKNIQYTKSQQKCISYDTIADSFENDENYAVEYNEGEEFIPTKLINETTSEIQRMIDDPVLNDLSPNECKVGLAIINLLQHWEEVLSGDASNKMQKSSVLYFLREETMMTTKEVRDNMKKFRSLYYLIKKGLIK